MESRWPIREDVGSAGADSNVSRMAWPGFGTLSFLFLSPEDLTHSHVNAAATLLPLYCRAAHVLELHGTFLLTAAYSVMTRAQIHQAEGADPRLQRAGGHAAEPDRRRLLQQAS